MILLPFAQANNFKDYSGNNHEIEVIGTPQFQRISPHPNYETSLSFNGRGESWLNIPTTVMNYNSEYWLISARLFCRESRAENIIAEFKSNENNYIQFIRTAEGFWGTKFCVGGTVTYAPYRGRIFPYTWNHVVFFYSPVGGVNVYLNGIHRGNYIWSRQSWGALQLKMFETFDGCVSDLTIGDDQLTTELFNELQLPPFPKTIVAAYYDQTKTLQNRTFLLTEREAFNFDLDNRTLETTNGNALVIPVKDSTYLLMKIAESESENSIAYDNITPLNYTIPKANLQTGEIGSWFYSAPINIDMGYISPVEVSVYSGDLGFEFRKNGGDWKTTTDTVIDGDTVEVRMIVGHDFYEQPKTSILKIGPYLMKVGWDFSTTSLVISEIRILSMIPRYVSEQVPTSWGISGASPQLLLKSPPFMTLGAFAPQLIIRNI